MFEWLNLDWWRYSWIPLFTGALVFLATTWKNTSDTRGARDARLDIRQDKELARLAAEAEDARRDRDRNWDALLRVLQHAHEQRHACLNMVATYNSLRSVILLHFSGALKREQVKDALEAQGVLPPPPPVPTLKELGVDEH